MKTDKLKLKKAMIITAAALVVICMTAAAMLYFGIIKINHPSKDNYPIRGVDVSEYQGEIDWSVLADQDIDFAFIKATEGSSYTDERFAANWENAPKTDLRIGAYHFFSLESSGKTQAEHFCDTVQSVPNMLPPVVDVEPYGEYKDISEKDIAELTDWLTATEENYGVKPIIYTTTKWYNKLIKDSFPDHNIWIRSVYSKPDKDVKWTFWQYSDRMRLDGYDGEEKFIDMNVFCGSAEEFSGYPNRTVVLCTFA